MRALLASINAQGVQDPTPVTLENVRDALPGVTLAGCQEVGDLTGNWSLRNRLAKRTMGVHQAGDTYARAGCALVWDRSRVLVTRRSVHVGVRPGRGDEMHTRYILDDDVCIDAQMFVTAIVAHRPPQRLDHLWDTFDENLAERVDAARHPVVLFMDQNSHRLPEPLRAQLVAHTIEIDTIATSPGLTRAEPFLLPATRSDHRPLALPVEVRRIR